MKAISFTRKRLLANLSLAMLAFAASDAFSATKIFNCVSGSVRTSACWSPAGIPGAGDYAVIGVSGAAANPVASLTSNSFSVQSFSIGNNAKGTFNLSGGTTTVSSGLTIGQGAGIVGILNLSGSGLLSASSQTVGYSGNGTFTQTGGTNHALDVSGNGSLALGQLAGSKGTYSLSAGSLTTYFETVGGAGTGIFSQTGGTNSAGQLYVGGGVSSSGSYTLSGAGILSTSYVSVGHSGIGTFTQNGGTHNTQQMQIGAISGGAGTYNLRGGALNVDDYVSGGGGTGTLKIDGGVLNVATGGSVNVDNLYVGTTSYSGSHTLTASRSITVTSEIIGQGGVGSFTQSGGTHNVTGTLSLGTGGNGNGTFNMQGGTLTAGTIDSVNAGVSAFNFTGGTLAVGTFIGNLANNGGTLAPGASPGTTVVQGDYTQGATGILSIELGGTGAGLFDILQVTGTATLAGELDVAFWNGFSAAAGDSFNIVSATNLTGNFDTFNLTALGAGLVWNVDYLYDQDVAGTDYMRLSVQAVPEPEAYAMILAGLGLVGWAARRRKQVH